VIKVIVGYKVKQGADIQSILLKLRSGAMQYSGFISAENFVRRRGDSIVMVVYTWQSANDWTEWENSKIRQELLKEAEAFLDDKPKVTMYTVAPTVEWL
jgi:antibiotic biosynthesis monooxygenase (ABM) superfamily enzyme